MGLVTLVAPTTTLLTTTARVKDDLGIAADDISSDDLIQAIVERASSAITRECGRTSFGVGTYQETLSGSGSQMLGLRNVPILSVTSVLEDATAVPTAAADKDNGYSIEDQEAGALYRACGWSQSSGLLAWGSEAYSTRYILPGYTGTLRYTVTYQAGYALPSQTEDPAYDPGSVVAEGASPPPLPGAIEQACLLTVKAWWFARARDVTVSAEKIGARSVTYEVGLSDLALPTVALGLLRDYRRVS